MATLLDEIRNAVRALARAPAFAATVILTLALAIGATTALFSVVRGVLLSPLAFHQPDRLVRFFTAWASYPQGSISPVELHSDFPSLRSIQGMAAWAPAGANLVLENDAVHVTVGRGSASLAGVLGIAPARGRWFSSEEEQEGHERVAVLGASLWRSRFHADESVVGRTVVLDRDPYVVIGVLGGELDLPEKFDLWVPLAFSPQQLAEPARGNHPLRVIGRIAPGVTVDGAQREAAQLGATMSAAHPDAYPAEARFSIAVVPLRAQMVARVRTLLWCLFGAVTLVLLMACANAGNLFLARGAARERELAVRAALGAGRAELVRHLLCESVVLALCAGALGGLLAAWSVDLLLALGPADLPRAGTIHLDAPVFAFALAISLGSGVLFGIAPAVTASQVDVQEALRTVNASAPRRARKMRRLLVATDVALALILLSGAALLLRGFSRLMRVDAGFEPEHAVTMRVSVPGPPGIENEDDFERYRRFMAAALQRMRELPDVNAVGAVSALPMSGSASDEAFEIEGRATPAGAERRDEELRLVTPGWFAAAGMRVLRGRDVADTDDAKAPLTGVVNEAFARKHFPGEDPIGRRLTFMTREPHWITVVGVVNDVREFGLDAEVKPILYVPFAQRPSPTMTFVLRSARPLGDVARMAQSAVAAIDPRQPVFAVRPLRDLVARSLAHRTFALVVVQAFSTIALLLAAIGLYGVLAYGVALRTREFGIRVALGAQRGHVLGLVARESAAVMLAGVTAGLAGSVAAAHSASSLVYGGSTLDVPALIAAATLLSAVCAVATLIPARRATRVDPVVALQAE